MGMDYNYYSIICWIALGIVSIVTGNIGAVFHLIINIIVVYYLYRPNVKMFFGKGTTTAMST